MEILWGKRPLASCQRSEEVIGSYSSSFNNKAASLIAFGAELRPLPFCMFPEETFDIAALVASGNVPVDLSLQVNLQQLQGNHAELAQKISNQYIIFFILNIYNYIYILVYCDALGLIIIFCISEINII
jgi:hypothetical protein